VEARAVDPLPSGLAVWPWVVGAFVAATAWVVIDGANRAYRRRHGLGSPS
jgi:hypothetical protein